MVFQLIEEKVRFLLLEKIMMLLLIIELEVAKLFLEQDLSESVLISLENGSQTKMLRLWFQIQHGQHTEVSLRRQDFNGQITDIITEKLEDLTLKVCSKICKMLQMSKLLFYIHVLITQLDKIQLKINGIKF